MKVRHDLGKRRILRRRSDMLKQYGFYGLLACYGCVGVWWFNKWMHPREYQSEEEEEKDKRRFTFDDAIPRLFGYIKAFSDARQNKQQIDIIRESKKKTD